jgi:hypothetical protein
MKNLKSMIVVGLLISNLSLANDAAEKIIREFCEHHNKMNEMDYQLRHMPYDANLQSTPEMKALEKKIFKYDNDKHYRTIHQRFAKASKRNGSLSLLDCQNRGLLKPAQR